MLLLERTGWGKRLLAKPSRSDGEAAAIVRPRKPLDQQPTAPITQKVVLAVAQGAVPFPSLVRAISAELYEEELRKGAGVLDIGLFGSRLFHEDVVRELHAGDGIFWDIEKPENH
jgi:hypothetical protein